jgi:hypothetical protein
MMNVVLESIFTRNPLSGYQRIDGNDGGDIEQEPILGQVDDDKTVRGELFFAHKVI